MRISFEGSLEHIREEMQMFLKDNGTSFPSVIQTSGEANTVVMGESDSDGTSFLSVEPTPIPPVATGSPKIRGNYPDDWTGSNLVKPPAKVQMPTPIPLVATGSTITQNESKTLNIATNNQQSQIQSSGASNGADSRNVTHELNPSYEADMKKEATELNDFLSGAEVDSNGEPWNAEIHSSSKAINKDGTWKKRRNVKSIKTEAKDLEPPAPPADQCDVTAPQVCALITTKVSEGYTTNQKVVDVLAQYGVVKVPDLEPLQLQDFYNYLQGLE